MRNLSLSLLAVAFVPLLMLTNLGCSSGESSSMIWRFAIEETQGSVQDAYAQEFKRRIEEKSGGAIEVRVFPYGTLGTSDDLTEQLRMGSIQFAMASPGHLGKMIPEVQVFLLHFLFSDDNRVNQRALADPALRSQFETLYREKGLDLLSIFPEGWMVWTTKKDVRSPEDFSGVKIRTMTSPLLLEAYRAYGASPQAMPYSEVYGALQLNMIDAQVNPVFAIEEMSFYEVTSHMIFARHAQFITTAVANPKFLDGLDDEHRKMVSEVVQELDAFIFDVQEDYNAKRIDVIEAKKPDMEIVELNESQRAAFRTASLPVRQYFRELDAGNGAILDAILAAIDRASQAGADSTP